MSGKQKVAGAPSWMVTFADMMSLLLALFVLMLSFSVMDAQRYKQIAGAMREAFGLQQNKRLAGIIELDGNPVRDHLRDVRPGPVVVITLPPVRQQPDIAERDVPPVSEPIRPKHPMLSKLKQQLAGEVTGALLSIGERDGRIVVSFPDSVAFPSGSATLSASFLPVLDKLSLTLEKTEGEILIAGHTDSTPITTERFRSNWDLSTARAVSVVHYWLDNSMLPASRLTAKGHADSRPVITNDTPENRAANRRVEISISVQ